MENAVATKRPNLVDPWPKAVEAVAAGEEGATAGAADTSFGSPAEARAGAPRSSLLSLLQFVEQAEDRCRSCGEVLHMHCVNSTSIGVPSSHDTVAACLSEFEKAGTVAGSKENTLFTRPCSSKQCMQGRQTPRLQSIVRTTGIAPGYEPVLLLLYLLRFVLLRKVDSAVSVLRRSLLLPPRPAAAAQLDSLLHARPLAACARHSRCASFRSTRTD